MAGLSSTPSRGLLRVSPSPRSASHSRGPLRHWSPAAGQVLRYAHWPFLSPHTTGSPTLWSTHDPRNTVRFTPYISAEVSATDNSCHRCSAMRPELRDGSQHRVCRCILRTRKEGQVNSQVGASFPRAATQRRLTGVDLARCLRRAASKTILISTPTPRARVCETPFVSSPRATTPRGVRPSIRRPSPRLKRPTHPHCVPS